MREMQRYAHAGGSAKGARPGGSIKIHPIPISVRDGQFDNMNSFRQFEDRQKTAHQKQASLQDLIRTLLDEPMTKRHRVDGLALEMQNQE